MSHDVSSFTIKLKLEFKIEDGNRKFVSMDSSLQFTHKQSHDESNNVVVSVQVMSHIGF